MYLHNIVSTSKATLPAVIAYTIIALLCAGVVAQGLWLAAVCTFVVAWIVEMVNVRNVLIRGYSHLTSSLFLILSLVTLRLTPSLEGAIGQLCFALFLFLLFSTYQDWHATGTVFMAYFFLGIGSLLFVQVLYFVPFLWLSMVIWVQVRGGRSFIASLMGLAVPYCLWATYVLCVHDASLMVGHFAALGTFEPLCEGILEVHLLVAIVVLLILFICSMAHYLRFVYYESIKSRMLYYTLFTIASLAFIFLILQPQHAEPLLRIIVLIASISLAHYFTFARDRLAAYIFYSLVVLFLAATVVVVWNV